MINMQFDFGDWHCGTNNSVSFCLGPGICLERALGNAQTRSRSKVDMHASRSRKDQGIFEVGETSGRSLTISVNSNLSEKVNGLET